MKILENVSLAPYTTFKIGGPTRFFADVTNEDELLEAVQYAKTNKLPIFLLGGGSNILIDDKGFAGLTIKTSFKGITFKAEKVIAAAGENWDDFVGQVVAMGYSGLENLSAIPGTVGATPVQNIGAYGMEVSKVITSVRAFDLNSMSFVDLSNKDCQFSYRDSIFKHEKGRYIIVRVDFNLTKETKVNTSYKDVTDYFNNKKITNPKILDVRNAVTEIRANKLPDIKVWGTAGSFFKNPIVSADHFKKLQEQYPGIQGFPESDGRVKVALGWVLDKICNFKGVSMGNVLTYEKQALALVAKPGATSEEVMKLADHLAGLVKEKTGIEIEREVEWVS